MYHCTGANTKYGTCESVYHKYETLSSLLKVHYARHLYSEEKDHSFSDFLWLKTN